jgi:hypothetical protein
MKTLLMTAFYSKLFGSEFGGKENVEMYYKNSLLNILNLKPNKVICFTTSDDVENLKNYFYNQNGVSHEELEFIVFDLEKTRYYKKIKSKKDLELIKLSQKCAEIGYNKFFWFEDFVDPFEFEKVYWIDCGLSHCGIFPEKNSHGDGFEKNFKIDLFNPKTLEKINSITEEKFLFFSRNNTDSCFWSTTLPKNYYNNYYNVFHMSSVFFGGNPNSFRKISKLFDDTLVNLLISEEGLFNEEQIFTKIYYDNQDLFIPIEIDELYIKGEPNTDRRYFYEFFVNENIEPKTQSDEGSINQINSDYTLEDISFEDKVKKIIEKYLVEKNLILT